MEIRKMVTVVEDIYADGEKKTKRPVRKVAAIAVMKNPCAGVWRENLDELIDNGDELGKILGERAVAALGIDRTPESSAALPASKPPWIWPTAASRFISSSATPPSAA